MTRKQFISNSFYKSLFLLLSVLVLSACVKVEDDEEPTPQDEDVMFQVDLVKMTALEIKEGEGDQLEIYGTVTADLVRGNLTESNTLWSLPKASPLPVGLSDVPIIASQTFTVASSNIAASNIEVRADLFDSDGEGTNDPEDLGNEMISTPLSSVNSSSTFQITLNSSNGQWVQLTYSITRL